MARFPASPPPLSNQDAYTTWPGGVDPTARVYNSIGGKRTKRQTKRSKRRSSKRRSSTRRR